MSAPQNTREGTELDRTLGGLNKPGDAAKALTSHQRWHPSARGLGHELAAHSDAESARMAAARAALRARNED